MATIDMGRKLGVVPRFLIFLGVGIAESPSNTVTWPEAYIHTKWHHNPSGRLATADMSRKRGKGGCAPLGELSPHLIQCRRGRGLPLYQVASWSIQPFSHNRHGPKIGGLCPLLEWSWVPI